VLLVLPGALLTHAVTVLPQPSWVAWLEFALAVLAVIVLNGVFVAGESAVALLRNSHVKQVALDERRTAVVRDALERKAHYVAACFLGSQTMRAWLVLIGIVPAFGLAPSVHAWTGWPEGWPTVLAAALLVGIPLVAVNVVLGELVPRAFAETRPVAVTVRMYGLIRFFAALFGPFARLFKVVGGTIAGRFGGRAAFSVAEAAEEEIRDLLESAEETGAIEVDEKEMLHSVFEFGDTVAREVMTPRVDIDAVPLESSLEDVAHLVEESGHSRIPVYEGTDDQIVGIVHAKDVLSALAKGVTGTAESIMRPAVFVPENKNLHDLLREMRAGRVQMVVVQDEFGGTAGVVTVEDIVEELVGEIVDEYDEEEAPIVKSDNVCFVGGKVNLYDLNDEIGSGFESEEFDTIGGYVFGLFGRQPTQGESIEADGYRFTVDETDGRRIVSVRIEPLETEAEGPLGDLVPG
jgi:putative hemolysin